MTRREIRCAPPHQWSLLCQSSLSCHPECEFYEHRRISHARPKRRSPMKSGGKWPKLNSVRNARRRDRKGISPSENTAVRHGIRLSQSPCPERLEGPRRGGRRFRPERTGRRHYPRAGGTLGAAGGSAIHPRRRRALGRTDAARISSTTSARPSIRWAPRPLFSALCRSRHTGWSGSSRPSRSRTLLMMARRRRSIRRSRQPAPRSAPTARLMAD